ncbi:MAG: hypothetical protein DRN06_00235 [Thermoprotei archaeon]|nr:MAG: hypothetical protein DRN06_00235 [Thermoprotei archaeon]
MTVRVNPLGLAAAASLFILAYFREAAWWTVNIGDIAILNASPFKVTFNITNINILPPIIDYLTLGAWLAVIVGAGLMILGSLTDKKWSKSLVSFGLSKITWELIGLVVVAVLLYVALGPMFNTLVNTFTGGLPGGLQVLEHKTPFLVGEGLIQMRMPQGGGAVVISVPLKANITEYFMMAVMALALSIAARIYQGRFVGKAH